MSAPSPGLNWYVRRGKQIRGPFTTEQLEGLRTRGRVDESDDISQDRVNWMPMSQFGAAPQAAWTPGPAGGSDNAGTYSFQQQPAAVQQSHGDGLAWFYSAGNGQQGPVETQQLAALLQSRQVGLDALVWRDGFPQWIVARDVPEFARLGAASETRSTSVAATETTPTKYRSADSVAIKSFFTFGLYLFVWYFETRRDMVARGAQVPSAWQQFIPLWNIVWFWLWCQGVGQATQGRAPGGVVFTFWLVQIPLSLLTFGIVGAAWGWWVQKQLNISAGLPA
jgi:hypothetical protein